MAPAPRRRRGIVVAAGALVAAFVALLLTAVLRAPANSPLTAPHRPAPQFAMSLYGGGTLSMAQLRGKTVLVNFWWSGCQPCVDEAAILERQWKVWKSKGVVFVGIDEIDDPASQAPRQFLKNFGVTYPNGWDPGDVDIQFGTTGQPETYLISPRGIIERGYIQPFSNDSALANFIRGAPV